MLKIHLAHHSRQADSSKPGKDLNRVVSRVIALLVHSNKAAGKPKLIIRVGSSKETGGQNPNSKAGNPRATSHHAHSSRVARATGLSKHATLTSSQGRINHKTNLSNPPEVAVLSSPQMASHRNNGHHASNVRTGRNGETGLLVVNHVVKTGLRAMKATNTAASQGSPAPTVLNQSQKHSLINS